MAESPRGPVKDEALETAIQGLLGALPVQITLENARLEPDNVAPYLHRRPGTGN